MHDAESRLHIDQAMLLSMLKMLVRGMTLMSSPVAGPPQSSWNLFVAADNVKSDERREMTSATRICLEGASYK